MRFFVFFIFLCMLSCADASTLNFKQGGNSESNGILKEYISNKINEDVEVVSYFKDINNDNKKEIIGIIKFGPFYSLQGYKLFVLKKDEFFWEPVKSDVYFDIEKDITIKNGKITYYKSSFYKNKKYKARIKNNSIKAAKSPFGYFANKKARNIEKITGLEYRCAKNDFELENFHASGQRNVKINYVNLNDKTKHYLDLK